MHAEYSIQNNWTTENERHVLKAKPLARNGQILGEVDLYISTETYLDLDDVLTDGAKAECERDAEQTLRTLVNRLN
jgi:hypothetical protein